jgi:hypothetical protein
METIDIEKLKSWTKFGLTFSEELLYIHKITAISETFNLPKKTTKFFGSKLSLNISKNNCIYYKGKATEEFFNAWKQNKQELKENGYSLTRGIDYSKPTFKGGIHINPAGKCWYIIKYLTQK